MKGRRKGIALSYIYTILNVTIGLFMSAYVLRMLGRTEYGIYQTMTSFITYLALFEFGTGTIMTRNISLCKKDGSEQEQIQKNISTIWTVAIILSVIIAIVALFFYFSIDTIYVKSLTQAQRTYGKIIFLISVVKLILNFLVQTMNGVILGFEDYSRQTIVSLSYLVIRTLLVVALLARMPSSIVLVAIDVILTVGTFLYTIIFCTKKFVVKFTFRFFDRSIFRLILPLAFAMFFQTIVNMANNNVDKFVIGVVMSPEAVSVYSIGMFIFSTFSSLTTIPISIYMPQIAKDMRTGMKGRALTESLIQPCRLVVLIGGAVLFGFISVGKPFISLLYGHDYLQAWLIAVVVMIPMFINMTNGVLVNVLDVLRKRHIRSLCLGLAAIANIFLTVWWINKWGMIGAAAATAICTLIAQVILMNIYYAKAINIPVMFLFREAYKGLLSSLIISCIVSGLFVYIAPNNTIALFGGGILFCSILLICLWTFGANGTEKKMLSRFKKR